MADSLVLVLSSAIMIFSLFLIVIPAIPVSALVWGIAMVAGALTDFARLTPFAAVVITLFMAAGSTSGLWMPLFGMRGKQISILGFVAFFAGMIVGTAIIPIPFIGTIVGGVAGVILVEFARLREIAGAWQSGKSALRVILLSMLSELIFALLIIATFIISVVTTIP